MKRVDFGNLIKELRKECRDEDLRSLSQESLAMRTGLSIRTISRIENGDENVKLQGDDLLKLADALQLTSLERKELLFAAIGIDDKEVIREEDEPISDLDDLVAAMQELQAPAFVIDAYCDIVAANSAVIRLLNVPDEFIGKAYALPYGFNLMHVIFARESGFHKLLGENLWEDIAFANMLTFRRITLRYRYEEHFSDIITPLRKNRLFLECWQKIYLEGRDCDGSYWVYEYVHPTWGALRYVGVDVITVTKAGELYLIVYVPGNLKTAEVFADMIKQGGTSVHRLAPWPLKRVRDSKI